MNFSLYIELAATLRGSRPGVQSTSLIMTSTRKLQEIEKNGDHLAPWNPLSYPMVKTASLYDNFCKNGNYVIYDVIIWGFKMEIAKNGSREF